MLQLPLVTELGERLQWNHRPEESCILAKYGWNFMYAVETPWGSRVCRRADALQSNIFLLMSTLIRELPSFYWYMTMPTWPQPAGPGQGNQSLPSGRDTGTKKDHQSPGLEDLKCKAQAGAISKPCFLPHRGRQPAEKESQQHSETKEEFEQPWNPGYRSSWAQLEHCPPHIALFDPFLDYIGH